MGLKIIKGNIFNSDCQTIANTVNCVGVMGAGLALEFRLRYPLMYDIYKEHCNNKYIQIGKLWLYKTTDKWILNFPTKIHWKYDSKIEYLKAGLDKFVKTYTDKGIESIAFPILGSMKGNIPEDVSLNIMENYLKEVNIPVEIYYHDPNSEDLFFMNFKNKFLKYSIDEIQNIINGIPKSVLRLLYNKIENNELKSMGELSKLEGVGIETLKKIYTLNSIL